MSELTRFKLAWRDSLSEEARGFWRERFGSADTQAVLRKEISAKLKITLKSDNQLTCFRQWILRQDLMDEEAAQAEEEEARILHEHPDWTKDQVREDLLKRFYNRARATGDSKLGLKTIAADVKVETLRFDQEKFKEGLRTKLEAGLAELAQYIKANPKAQAAYEAFKSEVKLATK